MTDNDKAQRRIEIAQSQAFNVFKDSLARYDVRRLKSDGSFVVEEALPSPSGAFHQWSFKTAQEAKDFRVWLAMGDVTKALITENGDGD